MPRFADNTKATIWGSASNPATLTTVTNMSMAIHRTSANVVPAMLLPVAKLSRVAKFGSGSSKSGATQAPAQASRPQPADTPRTAEQAQAAFTYALAALSCVATMGTTAQPSSEVQVGGGQAASAYAQVEQQVGQVLDITA